jgi:fused signal recognition particle receptor
MASSWMVLLAAALVVLAVGLGVALWLRRLSQRTGTAVPLPSASSRERLRRGLLSTRERLAGQLDVVLGRGPGDVTRVLPELEEALVSADVGVRTAAELVARVKTRVGSTADGSGIRRALREEIEATLGAEEAPVPSVRPWVVLVLGVNGVGKTTTIGKLAAQHAAAGRRVLLVAADTFRAAAIDQLGVWAERTGAEIVRQGPGANPAAVAFDGMKAARARQTDVVLVDTAGRLHTRANLMEELRKVQRVIAREIPGAPHEVLLVLDATTGQNAIAQARTFTEALGVTGIVLTKLDGTARGGVAVAVRREVGVPIRYIGVGEGVEDLRPFDPRQFAQALFDHDPVPSPSARFA